MKTILEYIISKDSKVFNSKQFKMFQDAIEKYLNPGIEAYNIHSVNDTQRLIKSFYNSITNIISTIETENLKIVISDSTWYGWRKPLKSGRKYGYTSNWLSDHEFSFKPHWRKDDDSIFELGAALKIKLKIKNIEPETLKNLGYNTYNPGKLSLNIYKDGKPSIYLYWNNDNFLPTDLKNEYEKIYKILKELNIHCNNSEYVLGKKSTKQQISIYDFFNNFSIYDDFTKYDLENGLSKLVNKIEKFFKIIDSSSKLTWTNENEFNKCGWYGFTAELNLIYKGKDIKLEVKWSGNYSNTEVNIKVNNEEIFKLDYKTTHWDAGLSSNKHYIHVLDKNKLEDLFN